MSFTDYEECNGGVVKMANTALSRIVCKWTIRFRMSNGRRAKLVQHVTGLKKNVISLSAESKGCNFSTSTGVLRISKGDGGELQGMKVGQLYRLEGSVWTAEANARHRSSSTGKKQGKQGVRSRNDTHKIGAGEITGPKA